MEAPRHPLLPGREGEVLVYEKDAHDPGQRRRGAARQELQFYGMVDLIHGHPQDGAGEKGEEKGNDMKAPRWTRVLVQNEDVASKRETRRDDRETEHRDLPRLRQDGRHPLVH